MRNTDYLDPIFGAVVLFKMANEQGFIGIAAYIACWVLFLPIMIVVSAIYGLAAKWQLRASMEPDDEAE